MSRFTDKLFGTHSEREIKRIRPQVDGIEALRPAMQALSDEELRAKTEEFKKRFQDGETLDDLLVEAYAAVREGARRALDMEAASSCTRDESQRCVPVKVRRSLRPCPPTSMPLRAEAST